MSSRKRLSRGPRAAHDGGGERAAAEPSGDCPICGRALLAGPSIDRHHWVPRSAGGREWQSVHTVCHRMIHRLFSERELARVYNDVETIRAHPDMRRFVQWVRKKPADYIDWPRRRRRG